jgi:hypothetical protein
VKSLKKMQILFCVCLISIVFFPSLKVSGIVKNYQTISSNGIIDYSSPTPAPPPSVYEFWSDDSYWHIKIPANSPSHPNSDQMIDWLLTTTGGLGSCNYKAWTKPIWDAYENTPTYAVYRSDKTTVMFSNVPIPYNAGPAIDADHSFGVIDWDNRYYYDFWNFWYENGKYWAGAGYRYSLDSDGLVSIGQYSVGGSNTPFLAMAIRDEEIEAGVINHPLGCCISHNKKGHYVYPPASRSDGSGTDYYAIPMGARIQLNPDIDLDSLGLSRVGKIIAKAMQEYGIVLKESGGGWHLYAEHEFSVDGGDWNALGLLDGTLSPLPDEAWAWRIVDYGVFDGTEYGG